MITDEGKSKLHTATFGDDRTRRYHLTWPVDDRAGLWLASRTTERGLRRCTFVMLNPSTADAFGLDNTISRCVRFADIWGMHLVEVVNLYAFRSTDPDVLRDRLVTAQGRTTPAHIRVVYGSDSVNDGYIREACARSEIVIAAWGSYGFARERAAEVKALIAPYRPMHLGLSSDGQPKHPLARGRSFIPYTQEPAALT